MLLSNLIIFFMSSLGMFQGPSCLRFKSDLAMHKRSLLSARYNLDFLFYSLFIYRTFPKNSWILTQIALYAQVHTNCFLKWNLKKNLNNMDAKTIYRKGKQKLTQLLVNETRYLYRYRELCEHNYTSIQHVKRHFVYLTTCIRTTWNPFQSS